eukprot:GHVU01224317.1.p1 GENE.GHVU01224317.1~~GHVU01224317.1.p1  ORF type:complete len:139 (+),score=12.89 GHVU01224317.1:352-768(+)
MRPCASACRPACLDSSSTSCFRLQINKTRIWDAKDCVKFIARDLWTYLFKEHATRLQTNKKGSYVIEYRNLEWLRGLPTVPKATEDGLPLWQNPNVYASFISGIIQGGLTNLGLPCSVTAETTKAPTYYFQVKLSQGQ